jgi:OOP family OmpA-OmpF porin
MSSLLKEIIFPICILFLVSPVLDAQTKKIKRPKSKVGIYSVDNFVGESFDLFDKDLIEKLGAIPLKNIVESA